MAKHSNLGASSASRWINCPGSNNLIEELGSKSGSSEFAELGSAAHELGEYCLNFDSTPDEWGGQQGPVKDRMGRDVITREFFIDDNMVEAVDVYVEYVRDRVKLGGELFIETKFDLSHLHPGMFGTADAAIYNPMLGVLEIVDYKHGQGVAVSPENNSQAMFYGLGALHTFDEQLAIDKIVLTIVQPRAAGAPIKTWETTPAHLREFGEFLQKAARATLKKDAKLQTGEWCKFCDARGRCPALLEDSMEVAKAVFNDESKIILPDPKLISLAQLKEILDFSDTMSGWLKGVESYAFELAERGGKIPGYKLVKKKANRRWKDEAAAQAEFTLTYGKDAFTEPKFKSPAQIEALKADKKFVATFTETPDNGNTLALEEDRRPEVIAVAAKDVFLEQ